MILLKKLVNWDFIFDKNASPTEHQKLAKSFIDFLYSSKEVFRTNNFFKIKGFEKSGNKRVITSANIIRIKRPSRQSIMDTYRICTEHFEKMCGVYLIEDAKGSFFLFSPKDMQATTARILYDSYNGRTTPPTCIQE